MALSHTKMISHEAMQVHVWDREFLLRAHSFALKRESSPYRRLSATLIVARDKPFELSVEGQEAEQYQGVIVGPNVIRNALEAIESDLLLMDIGITSPSFSGLGPLVNTGGVHRLTNAEVASVHAVMDAHRKGEALSEDEAGAFLKDVVASIAVTPANELEKDPRLEKAISYLDEIPLDELDFDELAEVAGVSQSYLRSLFRKHLRCSASEYAAWIAAWRVVNLWGEGMLFTDIALEAGFHDLSHMDHTVRRFYGITPTTVISKTGIHFRRYSGFAPHNQLLAEE